MTMSGTTSFSGGRLLRLSSRRAGRREEEQEGGGPPAETATTAKKKRRSGGGGASAAITIIDIVGGKYKHRSGLLLKRGVVRGTVQLLLPPPSSPRKKKKNGESAPTATDAAGAGEQQKKPQVVAVALHNVRYRRLARSSSSSSKAAACRNGGSSDNKQLPSASMKKKDSEPVLRDVPALDANPEGASAANNGGRDDAVPTSVFGGKSHQHQHNNNNGYNDQPLYSSLNTTMESFRTSVSSITADDDSPQRRRTGVDFGGLNVSPIHRRRRTTTTRRNKEARNEYGGGGPDNDTSIDTAEDGVPENKDDSSEPDMEFDPIRAQQLFAAGESGGRNNRVKPPPTVVADGSFPEEKGGEGTGVGGDSKCADESGERGLTESATVKRNDETRAPTCSAVDAIESERQEEAGAPVDVIGGVHSGKRAVFVKRTAKRVAVLLTGSTKPVYLAPKHVVYREGTERTHQKGNAPTEAPSSLPPQPPPISNDDEGWEPGSKVRVIGGTHLGKVGYYVKRAPKTILVKLEEIVKPVYLKPENLCHYRVNDDVQPANLYFM